MRGRNKDPSCDHTCFVEGRFELRGQSHYDGHHDLRFALALRQWGPDLPDLCHVESVSKSSRVGEGPRGVRRHHDLYVSEITAQICIVKRRYAVAGIRHDGTANIGEFARRTVLLGERNRPCSRECNRQRRVPSPFTILSVPEFFENRKSRSVGHWRFSTSMVSYYRGWRTIA
jgi:hypothetical protein